MPDPGLRQAFSALAADLLTNHDATPDELHRLVSAQAATIPATAFATELTPLETLARHTEDNDAWKRLLGRPKSTLDRALENSHEKHPEPLPDAKGPQIPLQVFDSDLSASEALIVYLREHKHLRNKEIAQLLGKDERNIATHLSRARKKRGEEP